MSFIDQYRGEYGVEPICTVLPIAPSTYYKHKANERDPDCRFARAKRDEKLTVQIKRVWHENNDVYGAVKGRGARCKTTIPSPHDEKPLDLVNRPFTATRPNQLWVADLTYVATWSGFVYVAFVVDVFARFIVGWRVSRSLHTDIVMDALEQALWARDKPTGLTQHSDSKNVDARCFWVG